MSDTIAFDEAYFLRGKETGVSNFTDYRWQPDATLSMATHLIRYLRMTQGDRVLDVGCARGYYVKALRMQGIEAFGYDISQWAVANGDPEMRPFLSNHLTSGTRYDYVFSKDTFEHIPQDELVRLVTRLCLVTDRKLFIIVPLAFSTGGAYVHPKEENDATHIHRYTLHDWIALFQGCASNFVVSGGYRYPGLKPGAFEVNYGYGFITMERV